MEAFRSSTVFITITFIFNSLGIMSCFISLLFKLSKGLPIPKLWKYSICLLDSSALFFGIGLIMHLIVLLQQGTAPRFLTLASASLMLFGYMDGLCSFLTFQTILLFVQNPRKVTSTTNYQLGSSIIVFTGIKLACLLLSVLPVIPNGDYFNVTFYSLLPLHWPEEHGGTYSVLLVICFWLVIFATFTFSIIGVIKSQRFTSLVNSATEDVWQISAIGQGQLLHRILLFEQFVYMVVSILITKVLFRSRHQHEQDNTDRHVAMVMISLHILIHGIVTNMENIIWTKNTCCRQQNGVSQESRRLKRLELLRMEHPGKFHFLASWIENKKNLKTGMMKVYNTEWLKLWTQEIMVLGILRKVKHSNLLQCLWTSNNNPYYEIVTLLSEDIVSSESRIICLEFSEYGCLREYLKKMEFPMSVASQCMITSDVAQGLNQLHKLDILHRNLSSIRVYLRLNTGNRSCLRASLGDFEYVTIFGSALQGADNPQCKNRQSFFLPDIRSFALITLEMVLAVCNKLLQIPKLSPHPEAIASNPDSGSDEYLQNKQQFHHQDLQQNEIKQNIDFDNSTSNEKIMYVKNKIGYFPAASEESLYQKWTDLNPESLNDTLKNRSKQEENMKHEQNGQTIFVAPATKENHTSKSRTESLKANISENSDSACSEVSMLVEVEKDSESEVSPAEADELLCHYKVRRQNSKTNRSFQSQMSTESDPYKYHWSSFLPNSDYSDLEIPESDQSLQVLPSNETEEVEKRESVGKTGKTEAKQTETRHQNVSGGFNDQDDSDNSLHRRINNAIQKKHKARKHLQKTLTSRIMPFKHQSFVLPSRQNQEPFKPRHDMNIIVNDKPMQYPSVLPINRKSPICKKSFSLLYNDDTETYTLPDPTRDKFGNKRSESISSYDSGDNSILCVSDVSYPASSSYTHDISSLSSATDALTKSILQEEENLKTLYCRIHNADDSLKKYSDSGFETESTPSNGTNNTGRQPMPRTHSRKLREMATSFVPLIETLPGSVDSQFNSQDSFGMSERKVDYSPNKETNIYSSFPCKNTEVNSAGNHGSERNEGFANPCYKKSTQQTDLNKTSVPITTSSPNVASERYRQLQRRGVPLKISIVSSNLQNRTNQISNSPNISANSDKGNRFSSDTTNGFFSHQKSPLYSCGEDKSDVQIISESQAINRQNSFTASVEGSPLFTTKVLGRPCPPTPTSVMPYLNFSSIGRPVLESRISCDDYPDYSPFSKSSMRRISLQNQDSVFVPSRQLSRLNSANLSHSSSLSHLSLPGKSLVDKYKLLPGVDEHQLGYCLDLVEKQPFICIEDLLPATESAFKHLRAKLEATGELTNAAKQLMDIVVICWYLESPPSTAKLCEQLKDPVMETTV